MKDNVLDKRTHRIINMFIRALFLISTRIEFKEVLLILDVMQHK